MLSPTLSNLRQKAFQCLPLALRTQHIIHYQPPLPADSPPPPQPPHPDTPAKPSPPKTPQYGPSEIWVRCLTLPIDPTRLSSPSYNPARKIPIKIGQTIQNLRIRLLKYEYKHLGQECGLPMQAKVHRWLRFYKRVGDIGLKCRTVKTNVKLKELRKKGLGVEEENPIYFVFSRIPLSSPEMKPKLGIINIATNPNKKPLKAHPRPPIRTTNANIDVNNRSQLGS